MRFTKPSRAHARHKSGLLALLIVLATIATGAAAAENQTAPLPTRWTAPPGVERLPHAVWTDARPFMIEERTVNHEREDRGRVAVIVEDALYLSISDSITRYATDLAIQGYSILIVRFAGGSAEDLRAYLIQLYDEPAGLVGTLFVGNLPYIVYEMDQYWALDGGGSREYEDFPCDIFFMDMDGDWYDNGAGGTVPAGNGKYDTWSDPAHAIEIWCGRMKVDNLPALGSPVTILNRYFARDHQYRTAQLASQRPLARALIYVDDDWGYMVEEPGGDQWCLQQVYSDVTSVFDIDGESGNNATAENYRTEQLPEAYQIIFMRSHGWPGGHGFYQDHRENFEYVYVSDYLNIDPPALFYSMFVCSGCDFTYGGYLGGSAAFNETSGLVSWGSTKTGGMWNDADFYSVLGEPACFGDAYVQWFNRSNWLYPQYAPQWWYGMVMIGDPALTPSADFLSDAIASAEAHDGSLRCSAGPAGTVKFFFPADEATVLRICDAAGRQIRSIAAGRRAAGEHSVSWNGTDDAGVRVPSGIYYGALRSPSGIYHGALSSTSGSQNGASNSTSGASGARSFFLIR